MSEVDRIDALIKEHGLTKRALAKKMDIAESTMFSWFVKTKPKKMKDSTIRQFAEYFGVSFEYLKTGKGEVEDTSQIVKIPLLNTEAKYETITFPIDYFRKKGIKTVDCKLYVFRGDGCSPYINDGDILLLDTNTTSIEDKSLYAIFFTENDFICRRLQKNWFTEEIVMFSLDGTVECSFSCSDYRHKVYKTCKVISLLREFI